MTQKSCSPVLKWVGGKRQLLPILRLCINAYTEKANIEQFSYHEPFFGGGALFFDLISKQKIKKSYINDINRELIIFYETIKSDENSDKLLKKILLMEKQFSESKARDTLFTNWKERFNLLINKSSKDQNLSNSEKVEISALLLSLNKTCFNGVYRKNKKGQFNVPFGKKMTEVVNFLDVENYKNVNSALQDSKLTNISFESAINFQKIKNNHLVFIDPPYIPISKTAQFKGYYDDGFSMDQHYLLAQKINEIDSKGAYFILTNSNTELVKDIYLTKKNYSLSKVSVARSINQMGRDDSEFGIKEILITNFKVKIPQQLNLGI
jgi:DNA adenine methylase